MSTVNISIDDECPICFEILYNNNDIINLNCCKKNIHISCMKNWYKSNRNRRSCFICNQENIICNHLITFYNNEDIINREIIQETIENDNIYHQDNVYHHDNVYMCKKFSIVSSLIIITITLILLFC